MALPGYQGPQVRYCSCHGRCRLNPTAKLLLRARLKPLGKARPVVCQRGGLVVEAGVPADGTLRARRHCRSPLCKQLSGVELFG